MRPVSSLQGFADLLRACSAIARSESSLSLDPITAFEGSRRFGRRPGWAWKISGTLSENNHTFLVCCGLWHEKPTFVASCGLMCPQNHTCVGRCGLVVASRACFPCKKLHPDPRTTRNFRHFRQGFKQDSKVRRLGRHFATPQYWDGIWSQSEAGSNKASNTIPQYWDGV